MLLELIGKNDLCSALICVVWLCVLKQFIIFLFPNIEHKCFISMPALAASLVIILLSLWSSKYRPLTGFCFLLIYISYILAYIHMCIYMLPIVTPGNHVFSIFCEFWFKLKVPYFPSSHVLYIVFSHPAVAFLSPLKEGRLSAKIVKLG